MTQEPAVDSGRSVAGWIALIGGPLGGLAAAGLLLAAQAAGTIDPQPAPLIAMAGVLVLMAVWWLTDAVPFAATALLPLALFPLLGIMKPDATAACYGDKNVYLYLGGFLVALAVEETGLHRRLALAVVDFVGDSPARVVLGFMLATGMLSMWLSNTATTMMMLPIALSILTTAEGASRKAELRHFGISLCLGVAYAASIGGIATPVGSPTNLVFFQHFDRYAERHPDWRPLTASSELPGTSAGQLMQEYPADMTGIGVVRLEARSRTGEGTFAVEAVRLSALPTSDGPPRELELSQPKSEFQELKTAEGTEGWSASGFGGQWHGVDLKVKPVEPAAVRGVRLECQIAGLPADQVELRLSLGKIRKVSFAAWTKVAMPIALVFLVLGWAMMAFWIHPLGSTSLLGGRDLIKQLRRELGPMRPEEFRVGILFATTAALWILREPLLYRIGLYTGWHPPIDESSIAIAMALLCFLVPARGISGKPLMNWEAASRVPWGILLLFGGGLALAAGLGSSGLDQFVGRGLGHVMAGLGSFGMIVLSATGMTFFTEITSNVASTQMALPILVGVAENLNIDPLPILLATTISASFAFMLPVGTPPNAIVYGTGRMTIREMAKTGFWMNIAGIVLVTIAIGVLNLLPPM